MLRHLRRLVCLPAHLHVCVCFCMFVHFMPTCICFVACCLRVCLACSLVLGYRCYFNLAQDRIHCGRRFKKCVICVLSPDTHYVTLAQPASQQCQQLINSQTRGGATHGNDCDATENQHDGPSSPTPPHSPTPLCVEDIQGDDGKIIEIADTQTMCTQAIRHAIQIIDKHTGKQLCLCNAERGTSPISLKYMITGILQCDPNHCILLTEDGSGYHECVSPETKAIHVIVAPKKKQRSSGQEQVSHKRIHPNQHDAPEANGG